MTCGTGGGHGGHSVLDSCYKGEATEENLAEIEQYWGNKGGETGADYLLHEHGTRAAVKAQMDANGGCITIGGVGYCGEKEYWKHWESACPAIRGDACCDGDFCCGGMGPTPAPVPAPTLAPVTSDPTSGPTSAPTSTPRKMTGAFCITTRPSASRTFTRPNRTFMPGSNTCGGLLTTISTMRTSI